ncbi:carboxylating nicotinate-nucleotide diphosphorylase [Limnoglobus roseus]|uniref:Probable nicotinate-nucleotide pyrophosphorylase [carboxylating] n=1 Tax=Limnoglobus roseus TaxID=2598579 RepID=A0A5C1AC72_9BACT|nr:carboxylating nicotinate-nucleotide diphosphorylase [Limnoglobus roseus]QEL16979.1 nicotinate-nucleotide diphosphorylase (carboxylating) [Limnoglobus roseus]
MTPESFSAADRLACRRLVDLALAEDRGTTGDRTTLALIPPTQTAVAAFVARSGGVIAGLPAAVMVMAEVDRDLRFETLIPDGTRVEPRTTIAKVSGPLQAILVAERTALNFLQRLSGVATQTRKFADAVGGLPTQVLDTRKTTPGWRLLEKYAVRMGGGTNHRIGLYDAILIKDNHVAGVGGDVAKAVELARAFPGNAGLAVEVEVDSLEQLDHVLIVKPEIVLLDNMTLDQMRTAVARRNAVSPATRLEASGGVNLTTIRGIAETGVDRVSVGALTHSAVALDIALDFLA